MPGISIRRPIACIAAIGFVLSLSAGAPVVAQAATDYRAPRAADGHPDLQGEWFFDWVTPLERPPEASGPNLSRDDLNRVGAAIDRRVQGVDPQQDLPGGKPFFAIHGEFRSALIMKPDDGRLPYTEAARARVDRMLEDDLRPADGPEGLPPNVRCLVAPGSGPYLPFPAQNYLRILQTPSEVVMHMELLNSLRVLPLDARTQPIGAMQGVVSARWEGDALVVRSTGFRGPMRGARGLRAVFLVTPATQMTERFQRTGLDEIDYTFTIDDPSIYSTPWTAEMIFRRSTEPTFENACHEGNYAMANILSGARMAERRAERAAQPVR
jgi:hypothetical protein